MPSAKALSEKKVVVEALNAKMSKAVAGVLVDYKGITVADDTKLRKDLREAGVEYMVVKNTLLRFAAEANGYPELSQHLNGTSAIAFSENDPVAAAKILTKYADGSKGKFVVKAGFVDGSYIDAAKVNELGKLPSREQLLAQLCSVLNGNIRGLACALNAIAEQKAGPAEEAAAE